MLTDVSVVIYLFFLLINFVGCYMLALMRASMLSCYLSSQSRVTCHRVKYVQSK